MLATDIRRGESCLPLSFAIPMTISMAISIAIGLLSRMPLELPPDCHLMAL